MPGETSSCRARLAPFCRGNGLDIGAGGDAICPRAICLDRDEGDKRRTHVGQDQTHLVGDAANLFWFKDGVLDYVYSSHCLEDFLDTAAVMKEWLRVIRPGGNLVLFLPDQAAYEADCAKHGGLPNQAHIHKCFSLSYVKACLATLGYNEQDIAHQLFPVPNNPYSFDLVIRKKAAIV